MECVYFQHVKLSGCSCVSPGGLERVKTELREEVSGHSSVSDVESDSDSPTEVNITGSNVTLCERKVNTELSNNIKYPDTFLH